MAAAYAALLSLKYIIQQLQHHPRPPVSIDQNHVQSLIQNVNFLQKFLEDYHHVRHEAVVRLQSCITEAAYAVEDVIETHIVDQIRFQTFIRAIRRSPSHFYPDLQKVIRDMDPIKNEVAQEERRLVRDYQHRSAEAAVGSSAYPSMGHNIVVGLDDVVLQLMNELKGERVDRQVIPIVGMAGIGKTTLAKTVYENPLIVEHFDVRGWITLLEETTVVGDYRVKDILFEILSELRHQKNLGINWKYSKANSVSELGGVLHQSLFSRRYLIVIEDVRSRGVWDNIKMFFPDNKNGSRIVITTKLSDVALGLSSGNKVIEMKFLGRDISWNLFCKIVFGAEDGCPLELEEIGKTIATNCGGLPLAIAVIGGLLAKSELTEEYWKYIVKFLNLIANIEDHEHCFKILHKSYDELPIHLKPLFLYMGIFGEGRKIRVSWLIKLWVAEGFLKPISDKNWEDVAEEYLKDLINRNLIFVRKWGSNGKVTICGMHGLLRELCLVEAERENFLHVRGEYTFDTAQGEDTQRRIVLPHNSPVGYAPIARSLICDGLEDSPSLKFKLLRILKAADKYSVCLLGERSVETIIFQLLNARYLATGADWSSRNQRIPSFMYLLWNLQTLIIKSTFTAPSEIWEMSQLRHVLVDELYLPDPPSGESVLGNLQTLSNIGNFKCGEEVIMRIPNIKKLKIFYDEFEQGSESCYDFNTLGRLQKLESLSCSFNSPLSCSFNSPPTSWFSYFLKKLTFNSRPARWSDLLKNLTLPHSLKKLTLAGCRLQWEDMSTTIGPLPHLQVLKLIKDSFVGSEWKTDEDQFCSLKFLLIESCVDLKDWTTEDTHFPCLEHLVLRGLISLKEIPSCIGDIATLKLIAVEDCSNSAAASAMNIVHEQEELGNQDLQVRVRRAYMPHNAQESMATSSFLDENESAQDV